METQLLVCFTLHFYNVLATLVIVYHCNITIVFHLKNEKTFKNEQRNKPRDAAAKKRANTSGVGKNNNYYKDIYIPPYNNTH